MILGVIGLFLFPAIGMLGLYLIQLREAFWVTSIGWILIAIGALFTIQTLHFVDRAYRFYPRELRKLLVLLFATGLFIGVGATGLDMEFRLTPIHFTVAVSGVCLAFAGLYLLIKKNVVF